MTIGHKVDQSVNNGVGPYIFKLHNLSHRISSLLSEADAVNFHLANAWNCQLSCNTLVLLQDMLYCCHSAVQIYKQAHELTRNMLPDQLAVQDSFAI